MRKEVTNMVFKRICANEYEDTDEETVVYILSLYTCICYFDIYSITPYKRTWNFI